MTTENIEKKVEQIYKIIAGSVMYDRDAALYSLGDLTQEIERLTTGNQQHEHTHACSTCKKMSEDCQWYIKCNDEAEKRIEQLEAALREKERAVATKQARIMDYINAEYDPRSRWEAGLFEAIDRGVCELRGKKVGYTEALENKIISLEAQLKQAGR